MIKRTKNSKVYVHCPARLVTGGTELLHQLVDYLNNHNVNTFIIYHGVGEKTVPEAFAKYNIKQAPSAEDKSDNIEVIPETMVKLAFETRHSQKSIWWMSVDNYFKINNCSILDTWKWNNKLGLRLFIKKLYRFIKGSNLYTNVVCLSQIRGKQISHFYQSEYARRFLLAHDLKDMYPLSDYINQEFETDETYEKENIVLYNPAKGYKFTQSLIKRAPAIRWTALKGFTRSELIKVIKRAKIYIDFGNHPGKDRLPRECASNGCVIITGKQGSAKYQKDIMIDDIYKFDEDQSEKIIAQIENVFSDYDFHLENQREYRESISKERAVFESEIKCIFNI